MKVLILEDVIEHQVRLERILDEISKESNIPISYLSLIHISEPTRRTPISYAVFCLKKKKKKKKK